MSWEIPHSHILRTSPHPPIPGKQGWFRDGLYRLQHPLRHLSLHDVDTALEVFLVFFFFILTQLFFLKVKYS